MFLEMPHSTGKYGWEKDLFSLLVVHVHLGLPVRVYFPEVNCVLQVILKIIKHCQEFSPALVTGQLLGLDVGSILEVTNCFPFPVC